MWSTLSSRLFQHAFLTGLLQTTGLSLALMTASAVGVRAETVTVQGAGGANGPSFESDELGNITSVPGPGDDGESVTANAGGHSTTAPMNAATAIGGGGGDGGFGGFTFQTSNFPGGNGGNGGNATATATTSVPTGSAEADAAASGGFGGVSGSGHSPDDDGLPGLGGAATATSNATALGGSGNVTSFANATGGSPGSTGGAVLGDGGSAIANSTGLSNGSGAVHSSASAFGSFNADATGMASASAAGGPAIAKASATGDPSFFIPVAGNATSNAESGKGALAQAQSTAIGSSGQAQSTAKTSFPGVHVQSTTMAPTGGFGATATTNSIAQAGASGQAFTNPGQTAFSFSTGLPDKAYATMLIDGASNVANALLGPRDQVFGTGILGANYAPDGNGQSFTYNSSSTFDFSGPEGDLLLGLINSEQTGFAGGSGFQSLQFSILDNGTQIFGTTFGSLAVAESFFHDRVFDLGALGPNNDLTFDYKLVANGSGGFGLDFAFGGVIPEPSTWAMMLLGFAGLGFLGYRQTRRARPQTA